MLFSESHQPVSSRYEIIFCIFRKRDVISMHSPKRLVGGSSGLYWPGLLNLFVFVSCNHQQLKPVLQEQAKHTEKQHSLPAPTVVAITSANQPGGGLVKYNAKNFTTYITAQGLRDNFIETVMKDKAGYIRFGSYDEGVSCYDGETMHSRIGLTFLLCNK